MPSQTFDERFLSVLGKEYPVPNSLPEGWPIYTLLHFSKTLKGRTTTQKILCNLMFEKNILLPYVFRKEKFGPFDSKIQQDIKTLEEMGAVKELEKEGYTEEYGGPPSYPINMTSAGGDIYQNEIKPKLETDPVILESFKVMSQLNALPSTKLAMFCYEELRLFNDINQTESITAWESRRQAWKRQIFAELSKNKTRWLSYLLAPEEFKFYFLTSLDYFEKILQKDSLLKIDQVRSGMVLYNISKFNNLTAKLFDFANKNKKGPDVEKVFFEISHLFYFVNEYSERIGLLPSVFNEDADLLEFMSEGDKKRVTAALNGN